MIRNISLKSGEIMGRAEDLFEKIKKQGKESIEEFILTRHAEELFLDFKRSADNGSGQRLHVNDRNNLAKAIAGFGNSEGGVIIWGVDCSKDIDGSDVAKSECPIQDVKKFVSWLEGSISGCTIPPHTGVQNTFVEIDKKGTGFAVTFIPKSENVPHRDIVTEKYYIRAGSSFVSTPHDVLAGMFGKRPQPKFKHNILYYPFELSLPLIAIKIGLHICNEGLGIAEGLFASIVPIMPGPKCGFGLYPGTSENCKKYSSHGGVSIMTNKGIEIPPGGWFEIATMRFSFQPPFNKELKIDGIFGCKYSPPRRFSFRNSQDNIKTWYEQLLPSVKTHQYDDNKRTELVNDLLGIVEEKH